MIPRWVDDPPASLAAEDEGRRPLHHVRRGGPRPEPLPGPCGGPLSAGEGRRRGSALRLRRVPQGGAHQAPVPHLIFDQNTLSSFFPPITHVNTDRQKKNQTGKCQYMTGEKYVRKTVE